MKITMLGSGCIWTRRSCASYMINDDILVDCGMGTLKQVLKTSETLLHHEKIGNIKLFLITHFHLDHYFDMAAFMWKIATGRNGWGATIITPPGGEEKIKLLCKLGMSESTYNKLDFDKYVKFVDASTMGTFEYQNFEITAHIMDHGNIDDYGYIVREKGGKTVGFSGDSKMCDNMQYMIDNCDMAFLDMAGTDISNKHYNIIDGIELIKKYKKKCNIVPCHLTSQAYDYCVGRINVPKELTVFDTREDMPYKWELSEEEAVESNETFDFASDKFARLKGTMVDLVLSSTSLHSGKFSSPTYVFDVVLPESTDIVGRVIYNVLPVDFKSHYFNVYMSFERDYELKSVEYDCCNLIKKVAEYHGAKRLYLTCDPNDFSTRLVFGKLGTVLQEIKTSTYFDENNDRQVEEDCIWLWEFDKDGKQ